MPIRRSSRIDAIPIPYIFKDKILDSPTPELFIWTLTHPIPIFGQIQPMFVSLDELMQYVSNVARRMSLPMIPTSIPSAVMTIAFDKIHKEWMSWIDVHSDLCGDEKALDNRLMRILYNPILNRDQLKCALCKSKTDLTIHHIIPKARSSGRPPLLGKSVPTNLISLCRSCHADFHQIMF